MRFHFSPLIILLFFALINLNLANAGTSQSQQKQESLELESSFVIQQLIKNGGNIPTPFNEFIQMLVTAPSPDEELPLVFESSKIAGIKRGTEKLGGGRSLQKKGITSAFPRQLLMGF